MTIEFWRTSDDFGCFSNFSKHQIIVNGKIYKTSEHYFQSQKFITTDRRYAEKIRIAKTPGIAAGLGRSRKKPLRKDWENIKDNVMRKALLYKVEQHPDIKKKLLSTGNEKIVEDSPYDYYWGCGRDGKGKNMLGVLWMELRDRLGE